MALPIIQSAIPKRRFQFGEFSLVVLGDIESDDGIQYHLLMGVIPEGASAPQLFISAEKVFSSNQRTYQMRVIAEKVSQTLEEKSQRWENLEVFIEDALNLVSQLLNLSDERPLIVNC
jgi:hypothetical protein